MLSGEAVNTNLIVFNWSDQSSYPWSTALVVLVEDIHKHCYNARRIRKPYSWPSVLDTTLCDQVCQWLATGWWFSPGTPDPSTNKTDHHDNTEILLKVALNIINHKPNNKIKLNHTYLSLQIEFNTLCLGLHLLFIIILYSFQEI